MRLQAQVRRLFEQRSEPDPSVSAVQVSVLGAADESSTNLLLRFTDQPPECRLIAVNGEGTRFAVFGTSPPENCCWI